MFNALMRLTSKLGPARILLGAWAAFAGLNAQAADLPSVGAAFGNTVMSVYPDGRSQKIWLHDDGSWDGLSRRGIPLAGSWTVKAERVCLRQSKTPTLPVSYCTTIPPGARPGVTWAGKDMSGSPIQLKLVKGIQKSGAAGAN